MTGAAADLKSESPFKLHIMNEEGRCHGGEAHTPGKLQPMETHASHQNAQNIPQMLGMAAD